MKRFLLVVLVHLILNHCSEQVSMTHLESIYNISDKIF